MIMVMIMIMVMVMLMMIMLVKNYCFEGVSSLFFSCSRGRDASGPKYKVKMFVKLLVKKERLKWRWFK